MTYILSLTGTTEDLIEASKIRMVNKNVRVWGAPAQKEVLFRIMLWFFFTCVSGTMWIVASNIDSKSKYKETGNSAMQ